MNSAEVEFTGTGVTNHAHVGHAPLTSQTTSSGLKPSHTGPDARNPHTGTCCGSIWQRVLWAAAGCSVLIVVVVAVVYSGGSNNSGDNEGVPPNSVDSSASTYFAQSSVSVQRRTAAGSLLVSWWVTFQAPSDVVCAVHYDTMASPVCVQQPSMHLEAMTMTAPVRSHEIELTQAIHQRMHVFQITLFHSSSEVAAGHNVLRSSRYSFNASVPSVLSTGTVSVAHTTLTACGSAQILSASADTSPVSQLTAFDIVGNSSSTPAFAPFAGTTAVPLLPTLVYRDAAAGGAATLQRPVPAGAVTRAFNGTLFNLGAQRNYSVDVLLLNRTGQYTLHSFSLLTPAAAPAPAGPTLGTNVALASNGATISGVSSNWAGGGLDSSFGGNKAIDGSGSTAWSSNGDGNAAWITVTFSGSKTLAGLGMWTRTMGTSAQISTFSVTVLPSNIVLGPYTLPSATRLYEFQLQSAIVAATGVRFNVVSSTGGNTGAVELAAYEEA